MTIHVPRIRLRPQRLRVWHLLIAIATVASGLWATDWAARWRNNQLRLRSCEFNERMYLGQANFLIDELPSLRNLPNIESETGWHDYMNERLTARGHLDLYINPEDWAAAFARSDLENRIKAAELRAQAASMATLKEEYRWRWWGQPGHSSEVLPTQPAFRPPMRPATAAGGP